METFILKLHREQKQKLMIRKKNPELKPHPVGGGINILTASISTIHESLTQCKFKDLKEEIHFLKRILLEFSAEPAFPKAFAK
jgi:hypothetical protein